MEIKTEIILHFVIIQKMLKAGICKIFAELSYWRVFSFHTSPQCWSSCLVVWDGWIATFTSADTVPVVSASYGLAAEPRLRSFYFSFLASPKIPLQAKVKTFCGKWVWKWTLFCPLYYLFFPHVAVRLGRIAPAHKEYFWFLHDIFYAHYWGKKLQFSLDEQSSSKWRLFLTAYFFWLSFCM